MYQAIGVMTGTSLDGIDIAFCHFEELGESYKWECKIAETLPIEEKWRDRLIKLPEQSAEIYAKTHVYLAHYLGKNIQDFIKKHHLQPDFVAVHGQTIFHQPDKNFTAQIADGETLVTYLDCPLIGNFRNKDVALGGQGAPLVPIGEAFLFPEYQLFLNLGGFANLTYKDIAFDVVPCNLVLNTLLRAFIPDLDFDEGGQRAASGKLIPELLDALNQLPYFHQKAPKSLGWEWAEQVVFPLISHYQPELSDALHTYTEHIAYQIAASVKKLGIHNQQLMITGGGRHNVFMLERISHYVAENHIKIAAASGTLIDFKEAIIFAFLGLRTFTGKTNTMPSVTGASIPAVCGSIHLPVKGGWRLVKEK